MKSHQMLIALPSLTLLIFGIFQSLPLGRSPPSPAETRHAVSCKAIARMWENATPCPHVAQWIAAIQKALGVNRHWVFIDVGANKGYAMGGNAGRVAIGRCTRPSSE